MKGETVRKELMSHFHVVQTGTLTSKISTASVHETHSEVEVNVYFFSQDHPEFKESLSSTVCKDG